LGGYRGVRCSCTTGNFFKSLQLTRFFGVQFTKLGPRSEGFQNLGH